MKAQRRITAKPAILLLVAYLSLAYKGGDAVKYSDQSDKELVGYTQVKYCDLVSHPNKYDGKQVAVSASYRYGFEWQELFCLKCGGDGKTWLEFNEKTLDNTSRSLRKAPRNQGIINAVFYGTFGGTKGPYGDGSYPYRFDVNFVRDVKVVSRDGWHPNSLNPDVQKQLCQE